MKMNLFKNGVILVISFFYAKPLFERVYIKREKIRKNFCGQANH